MKQTETSSLPVWVYIIVILGVGLMVAGAFISKFDPSLLANGSAVPESARIYTDYMFSRSVALAVMVLFLLFIKARRMLAGFMALLALIQLIDVIDDASRGAFILVPGLLVLAVLFLVASWRLFGQPVWHINTWRESTGK